MSKGPALASSCSLCNDRCEFQFFVQPMASSFDDTWLQSNAVVEPPTAPEEFDGEMSDIQRFVAYTKSNQSGPRLVAVHTLLWLCARSSLDDVQDKIFPAASKFASDEDSSVREAVAGQGSSVINYLRSNNMLGGSCFASFWQTCLALLTEKDAQIRVVCEDSVASVADCLADPLVLQPIIMPSLARMLQEDEDAVCTALRLMAEIAIHTPCQWSRDSVWPLFMEQVASPLLPPPCALALLARCPVQTSHALAVKERQLQGASRRGGPHGKSGRWLCRAFHRRANPALFRRAVKGNS